MEYWKLGVILLGDESGKGITAIERENSKLVDRMRAIMIHWLQGSGLQPVTWHSLVESLRKVELSVIANDIETVLSE